MNESEANERTEGNAPHGATTKPKLKQGARLLTKLLNVLQLAGLVEILSSALAGREQSLGERTDQFGH